MKHTIDPKRIRLIAFDLDGTLTQHKSRLEAQNRAVLDRLRKTYKLLMVGAGSCHRIFAQMGEYPIDIIGNYGLQYATYDANTKGLTLRRDLVYSVDRTSVDARITALREKYGFTAYVGENVEFHASGCVTFPILGTKAQLPDKLAFDPDRSRRRTILADVRETFSDYVVFVGGTSSFDMAPAPHDKAYALAEYCKEHGLAHDEVLYVGDDYGPGGNDESVFRSDFCALKIDDYTTLEERLKDISIL